MTFKNTWKKKICDKKIFNGILRTTCIKTYDVLMLGEPHCQTKVWVDMKGYYYKQ